MKTLFLNTMGAMKIMHNILYIEHKGMRAILTGTNGGGDHNDWSMVIS